MIVYSICMKNKNKAYSMILLGELMYLIIMLLIITIIIIIVAKLHLRIFKRIVLQQENYILVLRL